MNQAHAEPSSAVYPHASQPKTSQTAHEKAEESLRIRSLDLIMHMIVQMIEGDRTLPVEQASRMVANARRLALAMFPDKALAFDLLYWPRLQRMMRERYRMQ